MNVLQRPRQGRVIAGVCAGIARRFGWDPTLVRVLAVLSMLLPGPQVLIYLICWLVIPNDPLPQSQPLAPAPNSDARA
jgi:phage shock protein PspC (stress-responsive transcriptional regulator)